MGLTRESFRIRRRRKRARRGRLRSDLRRGGFRIVRRSGSHETWGLPTAPYHRVTLAGNDGEDAKPCQERDVREALDRARGAKDDG